MNSSGVPTPRVDLGRVLRGGLLAGGVLLCGEFTLNVLLLRRSVAESTAEFRHLLGEGAVALLALNTLALGVLIVWLHAVMREHLGSGRARWAASLTVWFLAWFHCALVTSALGLSSPGFVWLTAAWGLLEVPIAALAGIWLHDRGTARPLERGLDPEAGAEDAWSPARRFVFRLGAAFFAVQLVTALFDSSYPPREWAAALHDTTRRVAVAVAPLLVEAWESVCARSDAHAVLLGLVLDFVLALGAATLWSLVDRRRLHHRRLAGSLRVVLRYLVAIVLLVYGGFKVVNLQFPPPTEEELLRPLGARSPMALLWTFMGISPAYVLFAGLGEVVGAALLFFRRTTTLGALLLAGVLANVAVMNFAYDVPVKRGSALLLVAVIALAAHDARRLIRCLVLGQATEPAREPPFRAARWLMRVRAVLKPAIVVLAVLGPMVAAGYLRSSLSSPVLLGGVYDVRRFVRAGVELPPLTTDTHRWRRVILGSRGRATVQRMDDSFEHRDLAIDPAARTLTLSAASSAGGSTTFQYEPLADGGLQLRGGEPDAIEVELRALPMDTLFPLIRGGAPPSSPER